MKVLEQLEQASVTSRPSVFANLLAAIPFVFLTSLVHGQALSGANDLMPIPDQTDRHLTLPESKYSAYDQKQVESLDDLGKRIQEAGDYPQALLLFKQALHVTRINNGLYHESQLRILENIISSEIALRNWEAVDDHYTYMELLYRRLYQLNDPRLELGLRKVSSWHVNALNVNIDGKRVEHLRKASQLFQLRLQVAELTLSLGDPKFNFLAENIEICERELYLSSSLNQEMMSRENAEKKIRRYRSKQIERKPRRLLVNNE